MAYQIRQKKVVVSGNALLVRPLSRNAANEYRDAIKAAGDDENAIDAATMKVIGENVTFEDGSPLDVGEVPNADLVQMLRHVVGAGEAKGVADFTDTP